VIAALQEGGRAKVEVYAWLDVSDKSTQLCLVDCSGNVIVSRARATDPDVTARTLNARNRTSWTSATGRERSWAPGLEPELRRIAPCADAMDVRDGWQHFGDSCN